MNDEIFSDMEIEDAGQKQFGLHFEITKVIVRDMPTSISSKATIFLTTKNKLYAHINGEAPLLLADIKKIVSRMGLVADSYLPPVDEPDYFDRIGREKFLEVFPSRDVVSDDDLIYYRTLAPYNPALVRIAHIKNGEILGYSLDSQDWHRVAEYSYSKIKTS
jgi:hypothetical protein